MAKEKDSFLLYYEWEEYFEGLTDRQLGELLRAVFAYEKRGERYGGTDREVSMALRFVQGTLDRNREKYERMCERNRKNGKLGGGQLNNQNSSKKYQTTQWPPVGADHDHDPDRDHEPDPDHDPDREGGGLAAPPPGLTPPPHPPSQREVEEFIRSSGLNVDPRRFYDHYAQRQWRTRNGCPIDWQERARRWAQSQWSDRPSPWSGGVGNHSPGREEQAEEIRADMEEMQRLLARMKGEDGAESGA